MPGEDGRPQADCFPRAFLVLPDMRRQPLSERPQALSLHGERLQYPSFRAAGRTGEADGKQPARRAGYFPDVFPVLPDIRRQPLSERPQALSLHGERLQYPSFRVAGSAGNASEKQSAPPFQIPAFFSNSATVSEATARSRSWFSLSMFFWEEI